MTELMDPLAAESQVFDRLIQPDKVHGSLYTSPEIFAEGWQRSGTAPGSMWAMRARSPSRATMFARASAAGRHHDPGQGRRGAPAANRCAHRGNQVCDDARGNASSFRCPYHGWTYSNIGELLGYPYPQGYGGRNRLNLRLGSVPRVASYQGFVFGSFAPTGLPWPSTSGRRRANSTGWPSSPPKDGSS